MKKPRDCDIAPLRSSNLRYFHTVERESLAVYLTLYSSAKQTPSGDLGGAERTVERSLNSRPGTCFIYCTHCHDEPGLEVALLFIMLIRNHMFDL